jgi:anaerobic magnesium-protoporphyrin IX monomethyl ester cyclase
VQPNRFIEICKLLEGTENTYQFEIEPSLINDNVIHYLTKEVTPHKFRLEIGIQSLLDIAIKAVDRIQNAPRLLETIKTINDANRVTIHVDLIAGLPYEDLNSFKKTFNRTFLLLCEELQLGFLKLLRGTKLRNQEKEFNYKFTPCAPYEVISNKFISEEEMKIIKDCETSLEWMWNHKRAYNFLLHTLKDECIDNYFDFFVGFTKYYDKKKPLEKNYESLVEYLKEINLYKKEYIDDLKLDYLSKVKIRPYRFYGKEDFSQNELIEKVIELDTIYTKHILQNAFITPYYKGFIVITYNNQKSKMRIINE